MLLYVKVVSLQLDDHKLSLASLCAKEKHVILPEKTYDLNFQLVIKSDLVRFL